MNKLFRNAQGFAIPETIVIIAAVIFIVITGWIVYGHYDKTDATIILQRQQSIDKYISDITEQNYGSFGTTLYKRGYLTTSLYNTTQSLINNYAEGTFSSNPAYDKIICVDQVPGSYTYGTVTLSSSGDTATVPVNVFTPGSINPTPYKAYWVKNNGTWQLNNAECS